jgi:hypothetical protein
MRRFHLRSEASWTGLVCAAIHLMIIFTALYAGGAVARKFGGPQHCGALAALALVALVNMVLLLVRELPRLGLPFLRRWLMFCAWLAGWQAFTGRG